MFKPLDLFIGLRYTHKRKNQRISYVSLASVLGIMIGVFVLITILSVMNGFEKELRARILGMISHVTLSEKDGLLEDWQKQRDQLAKYEHVQGAAPYIESQIMITSDTAAQGVLLHGVDPNYQAEVSRITEHMEHGSLQDLAPRRYGIAIGVELAGKLGVLPGDKVTLITPHIQITPAGLLPRMKRFTVKAIYRMNMKDYDSATAFIHLDDAARLLKTRKEVTGIRLKLDDLFYAPQFAQQLEKNLGQRYKATDWAEANQVFFAAVKMERIAMFIILSFIVLIAAFYLLASLVMLVSDKQADIAILRTLGMSPNTIRNVFIIQGSLLGIIGTLLGVLLGVSLALNIETLLPQIEALFGFEIFPADVYYIAYVPSDLRADDVWIVTIGSILMAILATIPASRRAAAIQPVEALRYD